MSYYVCSVPIWKRSEWLLLLLFGFGLKVFWLANGWAGWIWEWDGKAVSGWSDLWLSYLGLEFYVYLPDVSR